MNPKGVHVSVLKKFTSVGAIVAFIRSPTGQMVIGKAKEVVTDPRNREKVAEFATKIRDPRTAASDAPGGSAKLSLPRQRCGLHHARPSGWQPGAPQMCPCHSTSRVPGIRGDARRAAAAGVDRSPAVPPRYDP